MIFRRFCFLVIGIFRWGIENEEEDGLEEGFVNYGLRRNLDRGWFL